MYTADDFNLTNAPKEMVQLVIDSVVNFDALYDNALDIIGMERCPLRIADRRLYDTISEVIEDWCYDHNLDAADYNIEEIFGLDELLKEC